MQFSRSFFILGVLLLMLARMDSQKLVSPPFTVSLRKMQNVQLCTGAIISAKHVIGAAHCFDNVYREDVIVHGASQAAKTTHNVTHIFIHPKYDPKRLSNDIAVVEVRPDFNFRSPLQQPIRLSTRMLPANAPVRIMSARPGYELQQSIVDNSKCSRQLGIPIVDSQFCTDNTTMTTCVTDQSGAVVTLHAGKPELVGVFSQGCMRGKPNVITRLSSFMQFIRDAMNNIENK